MRHHVCFGPKHTLADVAIDWLGHRPAKRAKVMVGDVIVKAGEKFEFLHHILFQAQRALVRTIIGVHLLVVGQCVLAAKEFATLGARER